MPPFDLASHVDAMTWRSLQNCITESREIVDPVEFERRSGFRRTSARTLWEHLDVGLDAHPVLSTADLLLAAACVDLACELVDDWEFETRVGFTKADAARLAATLRTAAT